jgi:hypothetical protein
MGRLVVGKGDDENVVGGPEKKEQSYFIDIRPRQIVIS